MFCSIILLFQAFIERFPVFLLSMVKYYFIWYFAYSFSFAAKHNIDVSVSKMKDLNTDLTPCYDGPDYSEAEFEKLGKVIKEKFHCTSPFLPKIYRAGAQLCKNSTVGEKVQNFIRATGLFATNMWKNDYYFLPPCTYNTYSYDQTNTWTG